MTDADLEAWLDEALPPEEMAAIEQQLRASSELARRLAELSSRRDAGVHTLGAIWRRHRVSCPSRAELGSFLLEVLAEPLARYIAFHLDVVGCRPCQANLADLRTQQAEAGNPDASSRRKRYFESSVGRLRT